MRGRCLQRTTPGHNSLHVKVGNSVKRITRVHTRNGAPHRTTPRHQYHPPIAVPRRHKRLHTPRYLENGDRRRGRTRNYRMGLTGRVRAEEGRKVTLLHRLSPPEVMNVREAYPILRMNECSIYSLGDANIFTTLDCNRGYWKIPFPSEYLKRLH